MVYEVLVGVNPFDFLPAVSREILEKIVQSAKRGREADWPPKGIDRNLLRKGIEMREYRESYSGNLPIGFRRLIFKTFIEGYEDPSLRPSLSEIKESILPLLE